MAARLQWTKAEKLVVFVAWLGWTFDIMDAAIFNLAKQPLVTEVLGGPVAYQRQGPAVEADILRVFLIGWSLGGIAFGWLADRWGRLRTLTLTVLMYSVFTGLTALCHSLWQVEAVRFVTGLGIGGEWAAGAALVAESVSEDKRARASSWLQSAAAFGPAFAAFANYGLAGASWRLLFLVGVLPAFATTIVRRFVREPERPSQERASDQRSAFPWKMAVIALVLGTAGIATAQNVSFWLPNLVAATSPGVTKADLQTRQSSALLSLHIGTLIGVFLVPWLCSRWGRKKTLLASYVLAPVSVVVVASIAKTYGLLLIAAPLMSVFTIGISAAFVLYFPELFPRVHRATGAGVAYNAGRILASAFPILTAQLIADSHGDVAKSVAQTALILAVGAIALAFAPETKGQPLPV